MKFRLHVVNSIIPASHSFGCFFAKLLNWQEGARGANVPEMKCYEEVVDFIASGPSPSAVADFRASKAVNEQVARLIEAEKTGTLTTIEKAELDHYLELEHIMRLVKARARQRLIHEQPH
jgi:hypothetical protein